MSSVHYALVFVLGYVMFLPQQLSFALQAVQQLNLSVHISDLILKVLTGDVYLLTELSKYTCQLPEKQTNAIKIGSSLVNLIW